MIHANNTNASYSANQCICSIAAMLQQLYTNVAADIAFRGHGAQFAMLDDRCCRIT